MKVYLVAAITVDGFIGKSADHLSTKWTSREDAKFFRDFSKKVKHLVVGSKTFQTFNRKLSDRKFYVYSKKPKLSNPYQNEVELVSFKPEELIARLQKEGITELMIAGGSSIYTQFLQAGVVTDVYLTVESVFFGDGVKLFSSEVSVDVELVEVIDLSQQTKVFHYQISKN